MKYYPFVKKWYKIKPHLSNSDFKKVLATDFNKFTTGRWGQRFEIGMLPRQFESCDWDWEIKGRKPHYWQYVKHAACHWLVNANLLLAQLVEPDKDWQIITSSKHSTVWDGEETLFDMNFSALQVDPQEAFDMAYFDGELLPIGKKLKVGMAENWETYKNRKK